MKLLLLAALLANTFTYGYMPSNTTLYSDPECHSVMTTLPRTYFVIVLDTVETGVYKVSYKELTGYVKDIEIVDYEPVTKFASASFTVSNDGYPAKLRSAPTETSEVLVEVPAGKSGYYYGDAEGSALIEQVGGKWHFVAFTIGLETYTGYVYSAQVTVSEIDDNVIEKVEVPLDDKGEEGSSSPAADMDFLLIALLTVPCVLIMFLVFKDKERKPRYKD